MRPFSNLKPVFVGKSLSDSGVYNITDGFPIGPSYRRLLLDIHYSVTHSNGSGAVADGDLKYLRALSFYDDRGNIYVNNLQGVPIYRRNQIQSGTAGRRTAMAATTAVYSTLFCIDFSDNLLGAYDATIVDTQDVKQLTLSLSLGVNTDMIGTIGSDTIAVTADCYVDCTKTPIRPGSVQFIQQLSGLSPVDPAALQYIDIPKVQNEYLKRLMVLTANSAGSYPFSGTPAANTIAKMTFQSDQELEYNQILVSLLNAVNKLDYKAETALTGWHIFDFLKGGALDEALETWKYSTLQLNWTNDTVSSSQVSVMQERLILRK
jgi:hypothetical protein